MINCSTGLRAVVVVFAALFLLSCSSNPKEEDTADDEESAGLFSIGDRAASRSALAVPPDLLGSSTDKVRANQKGVAGGSGYEVLPEVVGATVQSADGRSWLTIDADAAVVWRKLTEFWAFEEIELVTLQPESGLMETDWFVKTKKADGGTGITSIAADLFDAFTSRRTALDKFTIRLERAGEGKTNLYAVHRSREKIAKEPNNKQEITIFEWVEREGNQEKVAQLLQAIVLLFGADAEGDEVEGEAEGSPS